MYRAKRDWLKSTEDRQGTTALSRPLYYHHDPQRLGLGSMYWPHEADLFIYQRGPQPKPSEAFNHRWAYWDPLALVEEKSLRCWQCPAAGYLYRKTWPLRPRKIVDIDETLYLVPRVYESKVQSLPPKLLSLLILT